VKGEVEGHSLITVSCSIRFLGCRSVRLPCLLAVHASLLHASSSTALPLLVSSGLRDFTERCANFIIWLFNYACWFHNLPVASENREAKTFCFAFLHHPASSLVCFERSILMICSFHRHELSLSQQTRRDPPNIRRKTYLAFLSTHDKKRAKALLQF